MLSTGATAGVTHFTGEEEEVEELPPDGSSSVIREVLTSEIRPLLEPPAPPDSPPGH